MPINSGRLAALTAGCSMTSLTVCARAGAERRRVVRRTERRAVNRPRLAGARRERRVRDERR